MKTHTSNFKNEIKLLGKEIDSKITFGSTVLGKDDLNSVTPSFQGSILKSVMKELDIDSNVDIPLNTVLKYEFGVKVNGAYEYINFGNYVVYKSEKQEDTNSYRITCYDKMLYSMKEYEKMNITYPITLRNYINAVCSHLGLTFKDNSGTFANYNRTIQNELYIDKDGNSLGYTFRDVFDELAQATASTICINNNDELEIRYINDTEDTIDEEFLRDVNVNFGEKFGAVNTIVLSRSAESDNIYYPETLPANPYELKIVDNQIMNGNDRADYLPDIYNKLNGLEFYINDFSSTGICYYDLCDRYNVKVGDKTYSCVMFNDEILVTQGLRENVFTDMPKETKTDYTKADKTDRRINQTNLNVDKQNQEIQALVETVKDIEVDTTLTKQASGNPITIEDAGAYPCENFIVEGKSEQDGTPTPDTPIEIETVKGIENLFDKDNANIISAYIKTATGVIANSSNDKCLYIPITGGATYTISKVLSKIFRIGFTDEIPANNVPCTTFTANNNVESLTLTSSSTNKYLIVEYWVNTDTLTEQEILDSIVITKGEKIYPYVPYGRYLHNKITGKNLFGYGFTAKDVTSTYRSNTAQRLTLSSTDSANKVKFNYKSGNYCNGYIAIDGIDGTLDYSLSYDIIENTTSYKPTMSIDKNNSDKDKLIILISGGNGATIGDSSDYFIIDNIQIEKGEVATEYEPYKENIITYDLKKENLFDISSWVTKGNNSNYYSYSNGLLSINKLDDRGLSKFTEDEKIYLPNGTYYLDNKELPNGVRIYNDGTDYPIISAGSFKVTLGYIYLKFVSSSVITCQPKIYEGTGTDDYYELVSIGDIKDKLDEATGVLTKRIGKAIFNGSENWSFTTNGNAYYISNWASSNNAKAPTDYDEKSNSLSNYFVNASRAEIYTVSNGFGISNSGAFNIKNENYTSGVIADFKTWLSNNPVTVYYILAEPETIQLEPTEIELFKGTNNIYTLDDLEPNMNITYLTDTKLNAQYATKSELKVAEGNIKSEINATLENEYATIEQTNAIEQKITDTENSIMLTVNQKANTTDVNNAIDELAETTEASLELKVDRNDNDQIVSMINASAEEINLKANRFSMESDKSRIDKDGTVKFEGGTIGGFEITKHKLSTTVSQTYGPFNDNDLQIVQQVTLGQIAVTQELLDKYDIDGNGILDVSDLLSIQRIILGTDSGQHSGNISINSNNYSHSLETTSNGVLHNKIGIEGAYFKKLGANRINLVNDETGEAQIRIENRTNNKTCVIKATTDIREMDSGLCTLNSTNIVTVNFNKTFETVPNVVITPYTTTTGVIAPKINEITNTGFKATIGGSGIPNVQCCWIAIS